jgi:hypothetical protein
MAVTGRLYSVSFTAVSISAVQDLFNIISGASKITAIHSVELAQITQTTVGALRLRFRYVPATVTNGSGGGTATPRPFVVGDAAATFTARINDTTQASSSGTIVDIWSDQWNLLNGFLWVPPAVNRPIVVAQSAAFVVSLDVAPGSAITCSGTIVVEELP